MANVRKQHMVSVIGEDIPGHVMGLYDAVDYLGTTPVGARRIITGEWAIDGVTIRDEGWVNIRRGRACYRCGKKVDDTRCSIFCLSCRKENRKIGEVKKESRQAIVHRQKPEKPKSPLSQMAQEARDHGMSYGQYMTFLNARWFT